MNKNVENNLYNKLFSPYYTVIAGEVGRVILDVSSSLFNYLFMLLPVMRFAK